MNVFTEEQSAAVTIDKQDEELTVEVDNGDTSQRHADPNPTSKEDTLPPEWVGECLLVGSNSLLPFKHNLVAHFLELSCNKVLVVTREVKFLNKSESKIIVVLLNEPAWGF
jgi:hypothetical protein